MINSDYKSFEAEAVATAGAQNKVKRRSHLRMGSSRRSNFGISVASQFLSDKASYYYNISTFVIGEVCDYY